MAAVGTKLAPAVKDALLTAYQAVIDEARAEFELEKAGQAADWKIELDRMKESDTYEYNKEKRKRLDELELDITKRLAAVSGREESVGIREDNIADQESMLQQLQRQMDEIPTTLMRAQADGFTQGKTEAQKEFDAEVKLLQVKSDADKTVLNHQISALNGSVATAQQLVAKLTVEVTEANKRVEAVAKSAFDSAGQSKVTVQNTSGK